MECGAPRHVINDGWKDTICHTSLSLITHAKWVQVFLHTNAKGQPFLGDCVGSTVEVDPATSRQEMLLFGRVKDRRNIYHGFPTRVKLWLEDLCMPIEVELEDFSQSFGYSSESESVEAGRSGKCTMRSP